MVILKILHAVSALLGAAHVGFVYALSTYFDLSRPRRPDPASGAVVAWGTDEDAVYITAHEEAVLYGLGAVAIVSLLVCGGLTVILKRDARREGRTTLY